MVTGTFEMIWWLKAHLISKNFPNKKNLTFIYDGTHGLELIITVASVGNRHLKKSYILMTLDN